jgi:hypothetical protein
MSDKELTKIANFHDNIEKRACNTDKSGMTLDSDHISRLERIVYILQAASALSYFPYSAYKFYVLHEEVGVHSGLVYDGSLTSLISNGPFSYIYTVPHAYGEFSYLSRYGAIFFAGFFNIGLPEGECRVSIEDYGTCNGVMQSYKKNKQIKLALYPFS